MIQENSDFSYGDSTTGDYYVNGSGDGNGNYYWPWRDYEPYPENVKNIGWVCPKCGRAFSPWVQECPYCTKSYTITTWTQPKSGDFTINIDSPELRYL